MYYKRLNSVSTDICQFKDKFSILFIGMIFILQRSTLSVELLKMNIGLRDDEYNSNESKTGKRRQPIRSTTEGH